MAVHEHCNECYNINCQMNPSDYELESCCQVIECPSGCKISLHTCKVAEHQSHTCANYVIDCTNTAYGCPHRFPRHKLISHLQHCPASVVTCHHEWNRQRRDPSTKPRVSCGINGQSSSDLLDVSLAARDHKKLLESLKMPRRLCRALQNFNTRSFPAVPFVQRISAALIEDQEEISAGSLDFLDDDDADTKCSGHHSLPYGVPASSNGVNCSLCKARRKDGGLASSITTALDQLRNGRQAIDTNTSATDDGEVNNQKLALVQPKSDSPNIEFDLVMETFNSFRSKPKEMFTFLCAQDFRRDQFADHYLTVHANIQTGLDGWYQIRCPLSHSGCKWTQQRFVTERNEIVVYNPVTDSFCVNAAFTSELSAFGESDLDMLSSLPDLVLDIVFSYLDSLSLKNISLTSKQMREKCSYLLQSRGMVILDWKKIDGVWRSFEKVWSFSNAFDRPRQWIFADRKAMADHLKSCTFNEKDDIFSQKEIRIECLANKSLSDDIKQKLRRRRGEDDSEM